MERVSVIFEPGFQVQVPPITSSFPAVPSAYYYYLNRTRSKIPFLNNVGTEEEQLESLRIWYSFKSKTLFPVITCYAQARPEQLKTPYPVSDIALSMKSSLRQYPETTGWFFYDRYTFILSQRKKSDLSAFFDLFYQFPFNPSASGPEAARLLETYLDSGDEQPLRDYFSERGVTHLKDHPLGYYPVNELFFLMTRFASYPMTLYQLRLAGRRVKTAFNSPTQIFIDAIFYETDLEADLMLEVVDQIEREGPELAGHRFGTDDPHWVNWADEYTHPKEALRVENLSGPFSDVVEKLFTWTDFQLDRLLAQMKITPPFKREYRARYAYVQDLAGVIKRYRADPTDLARWRLQTQPDLLGMGSVS